MDTLGAERRRRFLVFFETRFKGDRAALMAATGLTKGRVSQLFDPEQPFGEKAAASLASRLRERPDLFERDPPQMGVAHVPILDKSTVEPLSLTWELLMQSDVLPADFVVALPDGALGPDTPQGALVYFRTSPLKADVGDGILVEDAAGLRYVRRMAQGPGGTWIAEASARGYASLKSDTDGLKLLAVAYDVRRGSGKV